jgi:hypothetical protein
MTETPKFRYVGVTDECVVCQKCGKPNLRSTVVLAFLDEDGNDEEYTYYGSTCAARALNVTGRGAGARVLGLARAAHRELVRNAHDGRRMLGIYGLPEIGAPTEDALRVATLQYADVHRNAMWARGKTYTQWCLMALEMLQRKQTALAEAARLGVDVPSTDRELLNFLNCH